MISKLSTNKDFRSDDLTKSYESFLKTPTFRKFRNVIFI